MRILRDYKQLSLRAERCSIDRSLCRGEEERSGVQESEGMKRKVLGIKITLRESNVGISS